MNVETFTYHGFEATVIRPEHPNGKWIWKTEFLYAFDAAERALCDMGYTRVYYRISNQYGSYHAVRLMHDFYRYVKEAYGLADKCCLFGFSRGGLYAFNFALFYPEYVEKIYLDAPVLDMRTWPPVGAERDQVYDVYSLDADTLERFNGHPVENFAEFFALGIPTLVVAGDSDELVPFDKNAGRMIDYANAQGHPLISYVKAGCGHHPHSLEDVTPIIDFMEGDRA